MRPSPLNRGPTPGWGSARGLIDLCEWSVTILPLAEPVRDVLGAFRRELAQPGASSNPLGLFGYSIVPEPSVDSFMASRRVTRSKCPWHCAVPNS
eukprot:6452753-Pyramimonas_sp.AAC.1